MNRRLSRLPAEPFARARAADVKNAPRYAGRPLDPGWIVAELSFRFWLLTHGPPVPAAVAADPILKRFRAALAEIYGDRIERVVLFGSRARGDASDDSDYDVALFMNDLKEGDLPIAGANWIGWPICAVKFSPTPRPSSTPSRIRLARIGTRRR